MGNAEGSTRRSEIRSSGEIVKCKEKMLYNVKLASDKEIWAIVGICELPNGELVVVDDTNKKVKLLDMQFNVVAHKVLPHIPTNMCSISPNEVAVACNYGQTIHLLTVNNRKIVVDRTLKLNHDCKGIACYKGNMFVTSGTALFQYRLDGQLVKVIYQNTSEYKTVNSCAVSADGSRLYVTDLDKLLTLSMDGTVLSSLEGPVFQSHISVHVSEKGRLLVCGFFSETVVQVDGEGGVVTLASKEDGLNYPECVCYSARTGRLIVGQGSDTILVIHTK